MKLRLPLIIITSSFWILTGCSHDSKDKAQLMGKWRSGVVHTEWGEATLEAEFSEPANIEWRASPIQSGNSDYGNPITTKMAFEIKDGKIIEEFHGGHQSIAYALNGDTLIISDPSGHQIEYKRVK